MKERIEEQFDQLDNDDTLGGEKFMCAKTSCKVEGNRVCHQAFLSRMIVVKIVKI